MDALRPGDSAAAAIHLPGPDWSSRSRGWIGMDLDVFSGGFVKTGATPEKHVVWVQASGSGAWRQADDSRRGERAVRAGDVSVACAGRSREWMGTTDGTTLVLSVEPSFLDRILARVGDRAGGHVELQEVFGCSDAKLATIATTLWDEARQASVGSQLYAQSAITQLGLHLIRRYARARPEAASSIPMPPHKLRLVKAHVEGNLAEDLSVEALARLAGMSPFHFAHAFRAATGMPPHKYVVQRRMEEAKALLMETDLTLAQIAHRVGLSQASHLSVAFHKATQVTPSAFRKAR